MSQASRPASWYNCEGKQPGNYRHPKDVTRYITCDAGLQAIEFDCQSPAEAEVARQPHGTYASNRIFYNETVDACVYYDDWDLRDEYVQRDDEYVKRGGDQVDS